MFDPVEAEELELVKIWSTFQHALREIWVEALCQSRGSKRSNAFTDVAKLVEAFCLVESKL